VFELHSKTSLSPVGSNAPIICPVSLKSLAPQRLWLSPYQFLRG
jgi:hypothetical protein